MLYFAVVYPHLLYGIEIYGNTNPSNIYSVMSLFCRRYNINWSFVTLSITLHTIDVSETGLWLLTSDDNARRPSGPALDKVFSLSMLLNISKLPAHGCLISALRLTPLIVLRSWIVYLYSVWCAIYGSALRWFKSYLSDRLFCVKCSHDLSLSRKLLRFTPSQGSVRLHSIPLVSVYSFRHCHSIITTWTLVIPSCLSPSSLLVLLKTSLAYKAVSVLLLPGWLQIFGVI